MAFFAAQRAQREAVELAVAEKAERAKKAAPQPTVEIVPSAEEEAVAPPVAVVQRRQEDEARIPMMPRNRKARRHYEKTLPRSEEQALQGLSGATKRESDSIAKARRQ
jgi:hypothetical protein